MQRFAGGRLDGGELGGVTVDAVYYALGVHVDAGVDLQTAAEDEVICDLLADALLLHKVALDIGYDRVNIVAVDGHFVVFISAALEVELLGDGGCVFIIGDVALVIHLPEDDLLALLVVLAGGAADVGVVFRGVVGDADYAGAFGKGEIPNIFVEIGVGGCADAIAA